MGDRAELALQLTGGLRAAFQALQRAGDKACRAYGLSHRAHAALQAVDQGGPDGARPSEIAGQLGVSRAAATTFIQTGVPAGTYFIRVRSKNSCGQSGASSEAVAIVAPVR